jgi:hypothetical protein
MNKVEKIDDENLPSLDEYLLNGGGKSLKEILLKIVLKNSKSKKTSKKTSKKASKKISKKVSKKKQVSNKKRKKVYRSLSPVSKYLI